VGEIFPINEGEQIKISGIWKLHPRYGLQFQAEQWEKLEPATLEGIERYLGSGLIRGVGPTFARRLVSAFGLDTLTVLSQEPHRLMGVEGIGKIRARRIIQAWQSQRGIQDVMVFLQGHRVSSAFALKIYRTFGSDTISKVKENPYCLANEVFGIGFLRADRIAGELGIKEDSPFRVQAGVVHVIGKFSAEGHCFVPMPLLRRNTSSLLEVGEEAVSGAVKALAAKGEVILENPDSESSSRVYSQLLYQAERRVTESLRQLLCSPSSLSPHENTKVLEQTRAPMDLLLEEEQRKAVLRAVEQKVLVITGGAGNR